MSHKQSVNLMPKTRSNYYLIICNFTQSAKKQTSSSVLEAKTAIDALTYYQHTMSKMFKQNSMYVSEIQFNVIELGAKESNLNPILDSAITFDYTSDTQDNKN